MQIEILPTCESLRSMIPIVKWNSRNWSIFMLDENSIPRDSRELWQLISRERRVNKNYKWVNII